MRLPRVWTAPARSPANGCGTDRPAYSIRTALRLICPAPSARCLASNSICPGIGTAGQRSRILKSTKWGRKQTYFAAKLASVALSRISKHLGVGTGTLRALTHTDMIWTPICPEIGTLAPPEMPGSFTAGWPRNPAVFPAKFTLPSCHRSFLNFPETPVVGACHPTEAKTRLTLRCKNSTLRRS